MPEEEVSAYKAEPKEPVIPSYTPYEKMNMLKTGARVTRLKALYDAMEKGAKKVEINGKIESIEAVIKRTQEASSLPELEKASQETPKPEVLKTEPKALTKEQAERAGIPLEEIDKYHKVTLPKADVTQETVSKETIDKLEALVGKETTPKEVLKKVEEKIAPKEELKAIPKELEPLAEEARKAKDVEEFVDDTIKLDETIPTADKAKIFYRSSHYDQPSGFNLRGNGIFFGTDLGMVQNFSPSLSAEGNKDTKIYITKLNIKNPYYMDWLEFEHLGSKGLEKLIPELKEQGYDSIVEKNDEMPKDE